MSGVITQISAVGRQDTETFISPTLTFWKSEHERHTPFALEPKNIEFQGQVGFGRTSKAILPRNGDCVAKVHLVVDLGRLDGGNGAARYVEDVGRAMLDEVKLEIGSVVYDRIYPELEHAYEEISTLAEKQLGKLTGKTQSVADLNNWAQNTQRLYIPLCFYFCDSYGKAIPVVALHLTDVKISVKLKSLSALVQSTTAAPYTITAADGVIGDMFLLAETVFLDDPERNWFAETQHKYLISQNQFLGATTVLAGVSEAKVDLILNHPVKELIILYRKASATAAFNYFDFSGEETGNNAGEAFNKMSLKLNGNERLEDQDAVYYRVIQNKTHHTRIPNKHVYTYSFALFPEDGNPSGSLNFSRIDNSRLTLSFSTALAENAEVFVYARNVNVSTIGSGVQLLRYAS